MSAQGIQKDSQESKSDSLFVEVWDAMHYAQLLPWPAPDANKYSRGHALILAGSRSYTGAAVLAARAASRMGCGYVTLAVPEPLVETMQRHLVTVPVIGLPATEEGSFDYAAIEPVLALCKRCDAVIAGPGILVTDATKAIINSLVEHCELPLLLDADALTIIAQTPVLLRERAATGRVTLLTPHAGEAARLLTGAAISADFQEHALAEEARILAREYASIAVLKGPSTYIAQGNRVLLCSQGSPALASAGTGDVLSGIIGALLSQKMTAFDAAALGVYLHTRAGVAAAQTWSEICVTAIDVIEALGIAVKSTVADASCTTGEDLLEQEQEKKVCDE